MFKCLPWSMDDCSIIRWSDLLPRYRFSLQWILSARVKNQVLEKRKGSRIIMYHPSAKTIDRAWRDLSAPLNHTLKFLNSFLNPPSNSSNMDLVAGVRKEGSRYPSPPPSPKYPTNHPPLQRRPRRIQMVRRLHLPTPRKLPRPLAHGARRPLAEKQRSGLVR